jgi:hypothetical protein
MILSKESRGREMTMEKRTSRWKGKLKIVQGLFLIAALTVSSQANGQRVIPAEMLSERIKYISSPNRGAGADILIDKKVIIVNKVKWKGNIGRKEAFWSMEGDFRQGWITDDGEYFVGCSEYLSFLPLNFNRDLTILSFFKHGSLIAQVRLDQLITDFSRIEKRGSQYRWCKYIGLNECGFVALKTTEDKKILLDVTTGKIEEFKPEGALEEPGCKRYEDIMRCYQFQYPGIYSLKESVVQKGDKEGFPTGYMTLGKDGKRFVWGSYENVRGFGNFSAARPFEDFAIERAGLMYDADGPGGSNYAKGVARKESFTNQNNLSVLELYFTVVDERYGEGAAKSEFKERIEGPVYAVHLSPLAGSYPYGVLFFQLIEDEGNNASWQKEALRKIVDSVKLIKAAKHR